MASTSEASTAGPSTQALSPALPMKQVLWRMRARQFRAVMRMEIRKNFLGWRALPLYLIAAGPVVLLGAFAIAASIEPQLGSSEGGLSIMLANIYEGLILRTAVFFGCAWMFMNLFRGEVVDKSLHYYFLAPMKREVLVGAKYASGLVASSVLFTATTVGCFIFAFASLGYPANMQFELGRTGLAMCGTYVGITFLACVGYGAVFLLIGLFFRNPIIPGIVIYGWEWLNFLLPPGLKKISIIHYLHSMSPVPISEGPFALVGDPTPGWLCILGLLAISVTALIFSGLRSRRVEIKYGTD
jgi:hypothetical protein